MASNAELRKAIREMAEELAEGVVKLISTMSLKQLADLTGEGPSVARALAERAESRPASKATAKGKAKVKAKPGRKPGRPAKPPVKERKLNRRKGTEIEKLRKGVLEALKGTDEWISAKEIGAKIGRGIGTDDLSFPINYLRDRGLVQKKGDRSQTRYKITDAGRAHDGNFTSKPAAPPAPAESADEG